MKRNSGFAPILIILLVVALIVGAYLLGKGKLNSFVSFGTPVPLTTPTSFLETVNLPVQQLVTTYGINGVPKPNYPKTVTLHVLQGFGNQLAAYGAAGQIVIAPKDWTGSGLMGATGGLSIDLHPIDSQQKSRIVLDIPSPG